MAFNVIRISGAFWASQWHGSYFSVLMPLILRAHLTIALALCSIPMNVLCIVICKLYAKKRELRHTLTLVVVWIPAIVCYSAALIVALEVVLGLALRSF